MGKKKSIQAKTPEEMENHLINLAMKVAEEKLLNGTATSQLICHFLSLATVREQLGNEKLRSDLKVAEAKIKQIEDTNNSADLYSKAIEAFRRYSGQQTVEDEDDEDY